MQKQFRSVSIVVLLAAGVALVGVQLRAFGAPEVGRAETVGHISVADGMGGVGLYTVRNTSAGWRITGVLVDDNGVANQIDIRQGGALFVPTAGAAAEPSVSTGSGALEAIDGTSGTLYRGTMADGQKVVIMVSPDATGPGSPGDPQALGFWNDFWREVQRRLTAILDFCDNRAIAMCGGAGNVCGVDVSAGPDGISCAYTCCGPHTPQTP